MLDDYQGVATTMAGWSPVTDRVEVVGFREHFGTEDELAAALAGFDIVITLRERVSFPASLLARLPKLKCRSSRACELADRLRRGRVAVRDGLRHVRRLG